MSVMSCAGGPGGEDWGDGQTPEEIVNLPHEPEPTFGYLPSQRISMPDYSSPIQVRPCCLPLIPPLLPDPSRARGNIVSGVQRRGESRKVKWSSNAEAHVPSPAMWPARSELGNSSFKLDERLEF